MFVWGRTESARISRRSPALRLLQQARDEAHRFAVTYNRKRRSMRTVTSELLQIRGVGPTKRRQLIQTFGSLEGVRQAPPEKIAELPGWTVAGAEKLLAQLRVSGSGAPDSGSDTSTALDG